MGPCMKKRDCAHAKGGGCESARVCVNFFSFFGQGLGGFFGGVGEGPFMGSFTFKQALVGSINFKQTLLREPRIPLGLKLVCSRCFLDCE